MCMHSSQLTGVHILGEQHGRCLQMPRKTIRLLEESLKKQKTTMIVMTCQGLFASVQVSAWSLQENLIIGDSDRTSRVHLIASVCAAIGPRDVYH